MESSSVSPKLLPQLAVALLLFLVLFSPVQQLQARELGGGSMTQAQHVVLPSLVSLVLPTSGGGGGDGDDDDGAAVPEKKLNALPGGVSRSGGIAPPAPKPGYGPHPVRDPSQDQDVVSSPGVAGNQKQAPPSPAGNPPPHYRGLGPEAADLLRVFWDALLRVVWLPAA